MNPITPKTAAAYIRVSDERQDEYSPDSQLKKIREYAKANGYVVPDEFVFYDDGISGKSTAKRSQFHDLIALAKEKDHPIDAILVWKFSRFCFCLHHRLGKNKERFVQLCKKLDWYWKAAQCAECSPQASPTLCLKTELNLTAA